MSIEIIKMSIGIIGIIILGILLIRDIIKPVVDNKLAVLAIGRESSINNSPSTTSKGNRFKTGRSFGTKSKSNSEFINNTTLEESDETDLLDNQVQMLSQEIENDQTELLSKEIEIIEDQTELLNVNLTEDEGLLLNSRGSNNENSGSILDFTDLINNSSKE